MKFKFTHIIVRISPHKSTHNCFSEIAYNMTLYLINNSRNSMISTAKRKFRTLSDIRTRMNWRTHSLLLLSNALLHYSVRRTMNQIGITNFVIFYYLIVKKRVRIIPFIISILCNLLPQILIWFWQYCYRKLWCSFLIAFNIRTVTLYGVINC